MSVDDEGNQGNGDSTRPSVTCDGERVFVAYQSIADNLVDEDTNGDTKDVFVSYYWTSTIRRVRSTRSLSARRSDDKATSELRTRRSPATACRWRTSPRPSWTRTTTTPQRQRHLRDRLGDRHRVGCFDTTLVSGSKPAPIGATQESESFISEDGSTISFDVVMNPKRVRPRRSGGHGWARPPTLRTSTRPLPSGT